MIVKTAEFKALLKEWDKKLEESGFEDIEDRNSPLQMLKKWDSSFFQANFTPETFEERLKYFQDAEEILQTFPFSSKLEKEVWRAHSEGLSLREIARKLRTPQNSLNKDKAAYLIQKVKRETKC